MHDLSDGDQAGPVRDSNAQVFDSYAGAYKEVLDASLAITGEPGEYFTKIRVERLRDILDLTSPPRRILDFGCGIGNGVERLLAVFPGSEITGVDVSPESLAIAEARVPSARFALVEADFAGEFDLAYSAGVFHHIERSKRLEAMRLIWAKLRPGGLFALGEHNPWNPGTRWIVNSCPFDEGVVLQSARSSRRMMEAAGFRYRSVDHMFFFPRPLAFLRGLESGFRRLPMGGGYLMLGVKPSD